LDGNNTVARSYVGSLTFSPDGELIYATMESSDLVVAVPAKPERRTEFEDLSSPPSSGAPVNEPMEMQRDEAEGASEGPESEGGEVAFVGFNSLTQRPTQAVATDRGPRGVVFLSADEAYVHNFIDRTVRRIDGTEVVIERNSLPGAHEAIEAEESAVAYPSTLSSELELGRSLFYSAVDSRMSADGSGVSCSTCHLDGRNDGLSWPLDVGSRQTPSLAGQVSLTAPVTWTSDVPTVAHEVEITSGGRMGGSGLTAEELEAVAAFIDYTPAPDSPRRLQDDGAAIRGAEVFHREEVGCGGCHSGAAYTDNEPYPMYGLAAVRTRSLVGIASSAPYLHDGSVADLGALLELSRDGSMGDTSSLSPAEMADLRSYLESL